MILEQYYIECLSHASYLVGDEITGRAVVIDPRRDISDYLADARRFGLTIEGVINTHFHADFVSGHLELVDATGAWIGFGEAAETDYPIRRLADGEHLSLGEVDLEIISTPGHTWESISVLIRDRTGADPVAVLTGDSLFIGDVGRPDLVNIGDSSTSDLARAMYHTIHDKLLSLPDAVTLIDVRNPGEREGGAIPGSLHVPLAQLRFRVDEIPSNKPIVVHCEGGWRSSVAASLLRTKGVGQVSDLLGGYNAWADTHAAV